MAALAAGLLVALAPVLLRTKIGAVLALVAMIFGLSLATSGRKRRK